MFDYDDAEAGVHHRFLVADLPDRASMSEILDDLYDATRRRVAERLGASIILRPAPSRRLTNERIKSVCRNPHTPVAEPFRTNLKWLIDSQKDPKAHFARFKRQNVYALMSDDYAHAISHNINPLAVDDDLEGLGIKRSHLLAKIQSAELDYLADEGHSKLPTLGAQRYYLVPSKRLVPSFLRAGNVQKSQAALDAIFFWLLPYLRECAAVVTDTWTISSISQNVSRRLVEYDDCVSHPCPIEMLGEYADDAQKSRVAEVLDGVIERCKGAGKILVLISATHSGGLAGRFGDYLGRRGLAQHATYVSLFNLSDQSQIPSLRDLSHDEDFKEIDSNVADADAVESAVEVDGSIYFPVQARSILKSATRSFAEELKEFAHAYADVEYARVHYTDAKTRSPQRHHMVWIDTKALCGHPVFETKLRARLQSLAPQPKIIVCPNHDAALHLAGVAAKFMAHAVEIVPHEDLSLTEGLPEDDALKAKLAALGPDDSLLLLDDAFITGARIRTYQRSLRQLNESCVLHYLTGVARPSERAIWERHERVFLGARARPKQTFPSTFSAVEQLILPDWDSNRCPWCLEAAEAGSIPAKLRRPTLAQAAGTGLTSDLYVVGAGGAQPTLGTQSYFGPENSAQSNVFCLVAHLLQRLRTEKSDGKPVLGAQHFLMSTALSPEVYFTQFSDPIFLACIWRAGSGGELVLRATPEERDRIRKAIEFLRDAHEDLVGELYVAQAAKKIDLDGLLQPLIAKIFAESKIAVPAGVA
jgi:hypothetical protein